MKWGKDYEPLSSSLKIFLKALTHPKSLPIPKSEDKEGLDFNFLLDSSLCSPE